MTKRTRQRDFLTTFSEGRSGRWQFWSFYAFVAIPSVALLFAFLLTGKSDWSPVLIVLAVFWALIFITPLTAAMARRFHDIGRSGWFAVVQFAVILFVVVFGFAYSNLARPDRDPNCFRLTDLGSLLGSSPLAERFQQEPLSPEKQAECDAQNVRIEAFDRRLDILGWVALSAVVASHLGTLLPLLKPSQPGPNRYGPNPHEVTP